MSTLNHNKDILDHLKSILDHHDRVRSLIDHHNCQELSIEDHHSIVVFITVLAAQYVVTHVEFFTVVDCINVFHRSKLDTSNQEVHIALFHMLSWSSYTTHKSISYSQNQEVLSYVVLTLASCESSVVLVASNVTVVPVTSLHCTWSVISYDSHGTKDAEDLNAKRAERVKLDRCDHHTGRW